MASASAAIAPAMMGFRGVGGVYNTDNAMVAAAPAGSVPHVPMPTREVPILDGRAEGFRQSRVRFLRELNGRGIALWYDDDGNRLEFPRRHARDAPLSGDEHR